MTGTRALLIDLGPCDLDAWFAGVARLAEGVVQLNMHWLGRHLGMAHTLKSRLRPIYFEPRTWIPLGECMAWPCRSAEVVVAEGRGNCLELAALLAAVHRRLGTPEATVEVIARPSGTAHAVVAAPGRMRRIDPAEFYPTMKEPRP